MRLASSLLLLVMLISGCGFGDAYDSDASSGTVATTTAPTTWTGPPQPAEDGTISVEGFNEYAQQELPESQRTPRDLAIEFLQAREPYEITLDSRPGGTTVTVLKDNLEDDSVRAQRHVLEFALLSGGVVNLSSAKVEYQCHQGRGHQNFSPELCL